MHAVLGYRCRAQVISLIIQRITVTMIGQLVAGNQPVHSITPQELPVGNLEACYRVGLVEPVLGDMPAMLYYQIVVLVIH